MNKSEFLQAIAESLEIDPSEVDINLKIGDVSEWDSLGHLTMLTFLDEKTQEKASEIDGIGSMESLDQIWKAFIREGLGYE